MSIKASVICSAPVANSIRGDSLRWIAAILQPQEQGSGTVHSCFPTCAIQSRMHCLQLCMGGGRYNSVTARCQERRTPLNADGRLCFRPLFAGCWRVITYKYVVWMQLVGVCAGGGRSRCCRAEQPLLDLALWATLRALVS